MAMSICFIDSYGNRAGEQKVNWFFKWLYKKLRQSEWPAPQLMAVSENDSIETDAMRIHLWNATGGRVVEFRKYDRNKDRTENRMYVISSDQDFAQELSKIITLETMR